MDKNLHSPAGGPSQTGPPNQHHAIQYSSRFSSDTSKPVPLAHFMGARRDLKGPVLTKQRVDEKEIRPDGWELAEKRAQQAQSGGGINSLASLLSGAGPGGSNMSSHAGNLTKRALPGMVPQDRLNSDQKQRNIYDNSSNQRDNKSPLTSKYDSDKFKTVANPSSQPATTAPISHATSFLKPKTLADRLAQLGVSTDAQLVTKTNITPSSPRADKFPIEQINKQPEHELVPKDSSKNINRIAKSNSAIFTNFTQQNSLEEKPDRKEQRPLSALIAPPRGLPTPSPQTRVSPTSSPQISTPKEPLIAHPNGASQSTTGPSSKKNTRPLSAFPHAPHISTESAGTLGVPSKVLTASLSRLAGSNIVAQRLEWSKQKEQLGSVDEFGSPLLKSPSNSTSSALHSQIPSPVLPSQPTSNQSLVFPDRPNFNEAASDSSPQSRLQSLLRENTRPKLIEPVLQKQLNQYNKSTRSDEDDDQRFGITKSRDNKRNKKNIDQLRSSSPAKKENQGHGAGAPAANDVQAHVTSPLRLSQKSRARVPRRPSGSSPAKSRATEVNKVCSPPGMNATRQLPSIPTFSPLMKKGTSELAAVWGTQLSHPAKKVSSEVENHSNKSPQPGSSPLNANRPLKVSSEVENHSNKSPQPGSSPLNANRPLPTPPPATLPTRPKTASAADSRPLPVPPSNVVAISPLIPEPRAKTRPLPTPQNKPQSSSHPRPSRDMKLKNVYAHTQIDVTKIWSSYEDKRQSLSALGQADSLVQLEIFQLNRNQMDEFSTTMIDTEDYGTFYSQESLLILCTLKGSKMVLMVWKGRDVIDDDDGQTEARIGRLLKKYGIERQSKLVIVSQGYEPPELVQALGGRLLLRTGDRFDSVYQRGLSAVFTCKSFPIPARSAGETMGERVVVIEENLLSGNPTLCTGYCTLLKFCQKDRAKITLYLWKGSASNSIETQECKLLAQQVRNESTPLKAEIVEVNEGNESDEFLSMFGNINFARSYHWKYKELVPMNPLITDFTGTPIDRISGQSVSVIWTGLEVFVLIPPPEDGSNKKSMTIESETRNALVVANSIALNHHPLHFQSLPTFRKRILAVHCLIFPTLIPVDLIAAVQFSADLERFNDRFESPKTMNLVSLEDTCQDPSSLSWLYN
ncbi:hypothetical protein MJO28_007524 [Puccinia striiformis f. sp. tritici]|uniref:Uncharacterized protein n=1 Tax=Puccinia striiformis f. sp. tritici TaxID=168172 RepID=A0ACC0EEP4_9BASI|nr:hypothetical protein MJO28_007524 [Puccinia striiformis f. sp. tritici]